MSDVFVSYKAEDRRRVKPLVDALEADGFSVWWDEQIGGGAAWRHEIETQLNAARCVIVVWSKRSVGPEGTFVHDEATRAQHRQVYVPVTIDKVHLPLGFGETQALPLTGWHGNRSDGRYQSVLGTVRRVIGDATDAAEAVNQKPVDRRAVLAGGAVAAVAVAGVGVWTLVKPGSARAADSIAVLPFANLSGDPAQSYFSDGIAEELRSALARLAGLKVVGRTSSEAVRNEDAETAAKKLGVTNILTGSVRQSPSVIRVNAQLIDGEDGLERWSQNYDRTPGDAIKIQSDIAENVARTLSIALGAAKGGSLTVGGTQNAKAHDLALQSDEAFDRYTKEDVDRAVRLVDEAIRLDPNFAGAHSRRAFFTIRRGNTFSTSGKEFARSRAEALPFAKKALSLAPNFAYAHAAMAAVQQGNFNIAVASDEYRRAVELAPGDALLVSAYSLFVSQIGNQAESLRLAQKALDLDPLNRDSYENWVGALFDARRYEEAVRFAEGTKRKSPELYDDPLILGHCLVMLGRLREAKEQYSVLNPDRWERLTGEAVIFARSGDRAGAEQNIKRMQSLFGDAASYQYAQIYANLGDKDRALASLEHAWSVRDPGLFNIRVDPFFDPLRKNARFQAIVRRMNFPA
jgi:TolB-like protein/Tfp pilus assembly protein PilF